jgi:hypothetical protein
VYWCDTNRSLDLPVSHHHIFSCVVNYVNFRFNIFRYHVYKQNQNRLNNNNTIRVNLNNVNQAAVAAPAAQDDAPVPRRLDFDDEENSENDAVRTAAVIPEEPQVPFATVFKTFVISFFSSIIPEAPAL